MSDIGEWGEWLAADIAAERPAHKTVWDEPHAYASEAGACARRVAYRVAGVPRSNPVQPVAIRTAWLGDLIHARVQASLVARLPGAQAEVRVEDTTSRVSGRADVIHRLGDPEGELAVREIKTKAPYAYRIAVDRGEGPSPDDVLQAQVTARLAGAAEVGLIYVRRDDLAIHAWPLAPVDIALADREITRLRTIVEWATSGRLPPRRYGGELIVDPSVVAWPCGYCGWRDRCVATEPGPSVIGPDDGDEVTP